MGTRGRGDSGTRGRGDSGTRGRGDSGTRGRGDSGTWGRVGCEDVVTQTRAGTRGRDKQATPDVCSEFVKYNFWQLQYDYSNQGHPTKFSTNLTNENRGG